MELIKHIHQLAQNYAEEFVHARNHLHMYPELSTKEQETAKYLAAQLTKMGIKHESHIAETGLVGIIEGHNPSKRVIALRADMDALPIKEENDVPYKSINEGVMHACGHDAHMACLLGAAKILNETREQWEGTIKLFFQPSEEHFPGGAIRMIKEGVLENPAVEEVYGFHVLPEMEAGRIGMKEGKYMASTDEIYLTVRGKGGHGATPDMNIDPIVITSHIIVGLQQIVSRFANPSVPTVLSFGRIIGEGRTNIIPNQVKVDGTLRTFDEKWRAKALERITEMASAIAKGMGGECEVSIEKGYPFLVNDEKLTDLARENAIAYLGKENVYKLDLRMTAEDFAYFSHKVPSCYFRLGVGNYQKGIHANLHTSTFDIDPHAIEVGIGTLAWLAISRCNAPK